MITAELQLRVIDWIRFSLNLETFCMNKNVYQWHEADFLGVSLAGLWHEFEFKASLSDYTRDFRKANGNKHRDLRDRNERGPNYFWFLVSEDMVKRVKLPNHAGLAVYSSKPMSPTGWFVRTIRKAPRLHSQKVTEKFKKDLLLALSIRLHRELRLSNFKRERG